MTSAMQTCGTTDEGKRCLMTRSIAAHRLSRELDRSGACEVPPKDGGDRAFSEPDSAPNTNAAGGPDYSLSGVDIRTDASNPMVLASKVFEVFEADYMKPPPPQRAARVLMEAGNAEYLKREFEKALVLYDLALDKCADLAMIHNNRGLALRRMGRHEEAAVSIQRAIEIDPTEAKFHLGLGKVLAGSGKLRNALAPLDRAIELDPNLASARLNRAWVHMAGGELDSAEIDISVLKSTHSQTPAFRFLQAALAASVGRPVTTDDNLSGDQVPAAWQLLKPIWSSLANGEPAEMSQLSRSRFFAALGALIVEQTVWARREFTSIAREEGWSALLHWGTAAAWLSEGDKARADSALVRAAEYMAMVVFDHAGAPAELLIDGRMIGSAVLQ